jgi:hypothetical protein
MSRLFNRAFLIENMLYLHGMIVASAPLLKFAIPKCGGELRDYYRKHLKEEEGHDRMSRDDLSELGITDITPSFQAAKMAGAQYYLIAHESPACLLGYMLALESNALNMFHVEQLVRAHGTELSCLRHHAKHDGQHMADLLEQIEYLTPRQKALVSWNHDNTISEFNFQMDMIWDWTKDKEALNA